MEEAARFILDDTSLTSELKNLRHSISPKDILVKTTHLGARNAAADIGPTISLGTAEPERNIVQAVIANARRAQESLRVLEELAKTTDTELDGAGFQKTRFTIYALEKTLVGRLLRHDKAILVRNLHAVVDTTSLGERSPAKVARDMLLGGATVIHLRDNFTPKPQLLSIASEIAELCLGYGALFIVDDALDIALAANAGGLYLDQDSLPISIVRKLLPIDRIIGRSVSCVSEAKLAKDDGADYLGCRADFATAVKPDGHTPNCNVLAQIKKEVDLPLVAIGGITRYNVAEVLRLGADGVAVASAIINAASAEGATCDFIKAMEVPYEPAQ